MLATMDGFSSVLWIVAANGATNSMPIRYLHSTHFVLEDQRHDFRHNEQLEARFTFVLDGKVTYLRFKGQIKLDNLHGIGLMFEPDSLLRQISQRLGNTIMYSNPCHFLNNQFVVPAARIG